MTGGHVANEDLIPAEHVVAIAEKYGWSPEGALKNIIKTRRVRGFSSVQIAFGFLLCRVIDPKRRKVSVKFLSIAVRLGKPPKSMIKIDDNGLADDMTGMRHVWELVDLLNEFPADERQDILDGAEYWFNSRSDNGSAAQAN
jgi:hypothetical protein